MASHHVATVKLRRRVGKCVPVTPPGTGWMTVPDGYEEADIEIHVDVDKLVKALGLRAMESKSGRSALQSGAVVVKAVNRTHHQD